MAKYGVFKYGDNAGKYGNALYLIYGRTQEDVSELRARGYYHSSDLVRVNNAIQDIAARLNNMRYMTTVTTKTNWDTFDFKEGNLETMRQSILKLARSFFKKSSTPSLDYFLDYMDVAKANAIERVLADIDYLIIKMQEKTRESGTFYAGEVNNK